MKTNFSIEKIFPRLRPEQKQALKKLGINSVADLLYHFPSRYTEGSSFQKISDLKSGDHVVLFGKISNLKSKRAFRKKIPMAEGKLEDDTGKIKIIWFHQAYIKNLLRENNLFRIEGKVGIRKEGLYISNPHVEPASALPANSSSLFGNGKPDNQEISIPVYPESRGITSLWLYHAIQKTLKSGILNNLEDPIPEEIKKAYSLPSLATALVWIHSPQKKEDALSARKRFAFEEIFFIQLKKQRERQKRKESPAFSINKTKKEIKKFTDRFEFKKTAAQIRVTSEILEDLKKEKPMSRLLEGDVGSGKTAVAATCVYAVTTTRPAKQNFGNLQTAYMAPTEILAKQQFENFIQYFKHLGINIGLITSSGCQKFPSKVNPGTSTKISRAQLLRWVKNGEVPILVGTHALIQKTVEFENLAFVVIDEQHRFGTLQRKELTRKDQIVPHLLSMTATPIPRTLALTVYGDLDLSLLDEMPGGRKPVLTEIVSPNKRTETYERLKQELDSGRQAYVICPRIEEPDPAKENALTAKSVKEEAIRLKKEELANYNIGLLHGKMTPGEKEEAMIDFASGKTDVLVATSVVEVGVNVPNATVIVIEGAERFGLAQLHQLRGRVIRSKYQAYCYLFSESRSKNAGQRLRALKTTKNGFELAEFDLSLRGSGELYGGRQSGITDIGMEALKNIKMVEAARKAAGLIVEKDPELKAYPLIRKHLQQKEDVHFE